MRTTLPACLCLLFLLFFSTHLSYAQTLTDVVYLKNGTIVKGTIIEQVPGKTIKVKTQDNLSIEIVYADIARIVKESTNEGNSVTHGAPNNNQDKPRKYFIKAQGGLFSGDAIGYVAGGAAGLMISRKFSLAFVFQKFFPDSKLTAGATQARYANPDFRNYSLKGFYNLSANKCVNPYFGLGVGYSSSPRTGGKERQGNAGSYGYYESVLINPSAGVEFPVGRNTFLFTELNYNLHRWTNVFNRGSQFSKPFIYANFISLTMGVKF